MLSSETPTTVAPDESTTSTAPGGTATTAAAGGGQMGEGQAHRLQRQAIAEVVVPGVGVAFDGVGQRVHACVGNDLRW